MPTEYVLDKLVTEKALLDFLGVKRSTLDRFRREGLPVCALDKTHRVYWQADVEAFLRSKTEHPQPEATPDDAPMA